MKIRNRVLTFALIAGLFISMFAIMPEAKAASAEKIDTWAYESLKDFRHEVHGGGQVLDKARAVLVFPHVYQAGFGIGGKYGQGALLTHGKIIDYYSLAGGSFGFQLGGARKSVIIAFMDNDIYKKFRASEGWQFGLDAAATVITVGKEGSINSENLNNPIVAFVVDEKGLMYDLSLEGTKITKIHK